MIFCNISFGNHSKSIETLKIELTSITTERNDLKIKYAELNNNYTILIEKVREITWLKTFGTLSVRLLVLKWDKIIILMDRQL